MISTRETHNQNYPGTPTLTVSSAESAKQALREHEPSLPPADDLENLQNSSESAEPDGSISTEAQHRQASSKVSPFFKAKRSYIPVAPSKKRALISKVESGLTIKEAAYSLSINYSTAKHIIK